MAIEKTPFRPYNSTNPDYQKADVFSIRLNAEERELLDRCKRIIEQPKDATALKTLAWIGANVIQSENIAYILGCVFKNKRNNLRLGIPIIE